MAGATLWCVAERPGHRRLPLGSLFEQAFLVVLDQIILDLMDALHLGERDLKGLHTTFE